MNANTSPISAAVSSSITTGSSGVLVTCTTPGSRAAAAVPVGLHDRGAERERPPARTKASTTKATIGASSGSGEMILCMPSYSENSRADGEQHHRDDEGVEVALPAVAERVLGRPGAPRAAAADEQQPLVARVGDRVRPPRPASTPTR